MHTKGYTLVEMMVSIAVLSIMMGIVGYNYNKDKGYQILKAETQRLASALRAIRSRDFNGVVKYVCDDDITRACTVDTDCVNGLCKPMRPTSYGLHIEPIYTVCANAPYANFDPRNRSCYWNQNAAQGCTAASHTSCAQCPSNGACDVNSESRSSYTIFADFYNSPSNYYIFDGSTTAFTGSEMVEEFKLPKDYKLVTYNNRRVNIMFRNGIVYGYNGQIYSVHNASNLSVEVRYAPNGTVLSPCGTQSRNQKGVVAVDATTNAISESFVSC